MCANPVKVVKNVVTGGRYGKAQKAKKKYKKKQAEAERLAAERQAELDRIAAIREQQAAAQRVEMERIQEEQRVAQEAQRERVAVLQAQQEEQNRQMQAEQLQITAAGQSLRVLAKQGRSKAPTATRSRGGRQGGGAKQTSRTGNLRVGSSGRGSGAGPNLGT